MTLAGLEKPAKPTKLIVLLAFVRDEEGELQPSFEPREYSPRKKPRWMPGEWLRLAHMRE